MNLPLLIQTITFSIIALIVGVVVQLSASADQVYGNETLTQIGASETVILNGTNVTGPVMTGQSIVCNDCQTGDLIAGQDITLNGGQAARVMAGHSAIITDAKVMGAVQAGHGVSLQEAKIMGSVNTPGPLTIDHSLVTGTVSTIGNSLTIRQSSIDSLELKQPNSRFSNNLNSINSFNSVNSFSNNSTHHKNSLIISSGSVIGGGPGQRAQINVQGGGRSLFNDYTVTALSSDSLNTPQSATQVVTPEGYVYRNGIRVGTDGPENYALYSDSHPIAPIVNGPGWPSEADLKLGLAFPTTDSNNDSPAQEKASTNAEERPIQQTLVLEDGSSIQNGVFFESGAGLVVLRNNSQVAGPITGGKIAE